MVALLALTKITLLWGRKFWRENQSNQLDLRNSYSSLIGLQNTRKRNLRMLKRLGRYIFKPPMSPKYAALHQVDPLWHCFKVAILTTNHRQGEGNSWTNTLNRIRVGELNDEDIKSLESRRKAWEISQTSFTDWLCCFFEIQEKPS